MPEGKTLLTVSPSVCKLSDVFNNCNFQRLLFSQNEEFPAEDELAQYENTLDGFCSCLIYRGPRLLVQGYVYFTH